MFRRIAALLVYMVTVAAVSYAANPFDEFRNQLTGQVQDVAQKRLNDFSKDIGALIGGGSFHQGENLGLLGFDIGVQVPIIKVADSNSIMKATGQDSIGIPIIHVEKGLPADFDLLARFTSCSDATLLGLGVRYGLYKSELPVIPSVSVQAVYNKLDVNSGLNKFSATAMTADAVVSMNLLILTPYLGIGMIQTDVKPDSSIIDVKATTQSTKIEGGVNLSLFPFTYIRVGATIVDGNPGYDAGLGVKF